MLRCFRALSGATSTIGLRPEPPLRALDLAASTVGGDGDVHPFRPWQVEPVHDRDELVEAPAAAEARVARFLLPDGADSALLIVVAGIDERVVRQRKDLLLDRTVERRGVAILEVGAAAAVDHQRIAGEDARAVGC